MNGKILIILLIVGVAALLLLVYFITRIKCPQCGSKKIEQVSKKFLRKETVYFKVQETIREYENNKNLFGGAATGMQCIKPPERVSVRERTLPGTRVYYRVGYRCKQCGKTFYRNEYVDKKPTVH